MKRYSLIILSMVIILTGCSSKSSFPLIFDEFTMKIYDNEKQYTATPSETSIEGIKIVTELKEITAKENTGFINSLVSIKTTTQSGTDLKELVASNTKQLEIKLFDYKSITTASKKISCDDQQYSGYMLTFSYQLDEETLYESQYFLLNGETLYIVSFSSDDKKDIELFTKSIDTLTCIQ